MKVTLIIIYLIGGIPTPSILDQPDLKTCKENVSNLNEVKQYAPYPVMHIGCRVENQEI